MASKLREDQYDIKKWFDELWDKTIKVREKHPAKHKPDITEAVLFWGRKVDNFMRRFMRILRIMYSYKSESTEYWHYCKPQFVSVAWVIGRSGCYILDVHHKLQ